MTYLDFFYIKVSGTSSSALPVMQPTKTMYFFYKKINRLIIRDNYLLKRLLLGIKTKQEKEISVPEVPKGKALDSHKSKLYPILGFPELGKIIT